MQESHANIEKKVHIETWGCQMNIADTERIYSILSQCNYSQADSAENADLIILNTCNIREKASHKVRTRLGRLRKLKAANQDLLISIAGCIAQTNAEDLIKDLPYVDFLFGPDQIEDLPNIISIITNSNDKSLQKPLIFNEFTDTPYIISKEKALPYMEQSKPNISKFVNIIKGCNNFCTYCVVPYTRGREKSRTMEEILEEVTFYAQNGVKEIVLLGQNVNSYGLDLVTNDTKNTFHESPFVDLIYRTHAINGVERLKFVTSNPHDFSQKLAKAFEDLPKLVSHIHLPVQSGSNQMLQKMNRKYTRESYLEKIAWLRAARPDISISTDIITGFPGETNADFQDTVSLVQECKFSFLYGFKYSARKGTPAAKYPNQIEDNIKEERLNYLLELQKKETEKQNNADINQIRSVLIMYKDPKYPDSWYGRTFHGKLTRVFSTENILGKTLNVLINDANTTALSGQIV